MNLAPVASQLNSPEPETSRPPRSDPFWSTPRSDNSSSLAALMAAVQQVVPPSAPIRAQRAATVAARRPQCTHVVMERVYGGVVCSICNRVPQMGWVYACRQDQKPGQYDPLPDPGIIANAFNDKPDCVETKARRAEHLQMSASVVKGIRAGDYSAAQTARLLQQREHLIRVMSEIERRTNENAPPILKPVDSGLGIIASVGATAPFTAPKNNNLPMSNAGTPANTPSASTLVTPVKDRNRPAGSPQYNCTFQVCHACRPFFQDRMYASFETVLGANVPNLGKHDMEKRHMMNPTIAATIGLRQSPPPLQSSFKPDQSADPTLQYVDVNDDDISVDWTPTTAGAESESSSDRFDISELYPCPGAGQCPLWSRQSGCAYDLGFDDGRRAANHGYLLSQYNDRVTPETSRSHMNSITGSYTDTPGAASSTASSVSLPTPSTSPLVSRFPTDSSLDIALQRQLRTVSKAKSICGALPSQHLKIGLHNKNSNSSLGSEIEVQGGVALTEEAVGSGRPDILTAE